MYNLNWSRKELTPQKLGTFCEYYAKMTLASYGLSLYTAVVDDHGIDFVVEMGNAFLKIQVKSVRCGTGYVFMRKEHFDADDPLLYLLLVMLYDGEHPKLYLIPASAWKQQGDRMFVCREYEGKKSQPEYGINLSAKNLDRLKPYTLETVLDEWMKR